MSIETIESFFETIESAPLDEIGNLIETVTPMVTALSSLRVTSTSESTTSASPSEVVQTTETTEGVVPPNVVTTASEELLPTELTEGVVPPNVVTTTSSALSVSPDQLTVAQDDATCLHRAFEGMGCDQTTIVKLLAQRNAAQRTLIRREYKTLFSEDFDTRLSKELMFRGDLKKALLLWMDDPASRDAKLVKQGLMLKHEIAIDVICSRTPSQIEQLKRAYHSIFGAYVEDDVESSRASGDYKKLLLEYVGTPRSESQEINTTTVDEDAKALYIDGEWKLGMNEETFIRIFSKRSWAHLAAVNCVYRNMYVNSLKKAVKKETSSKFKRALLTILQCAENPGKYFAKALHKAMDGIGTDEKTLSRIIVSRAEVDIQQIKAEYLKKYGKSLIDVVNSETSGQYREFMEVLGHDLRQRLKNEKGSGEKS